MTSARLRSGNSLNILSVLLVGAGSVPPADRTVFAKLYAKFAVFNVLMWVSAPKENLRVLHLFI